MAATDMVPQHANGRRWTDREFNEYRSRALTAFGEGFKRSKRKNLWRVWRGRTLTIFKGRFGGYCWCVGTRDGPSFSQVSYPTETEAIDALGEELGVGVP